MPVVVVNGDSDFDRKFSAANGKAVFVDFTASWCGPCKYIAPIFADLANQYKGSVFLKVDVDECRGTAATYGVNAMPTFIAFVNGQKKETLQGADESGLRSMCSKYGSTSSAWSGSGQRLSSTAGSSTGATTGSTAPPQRAAAPAGPTPLEPILQFADVINQRLNGLGIPNLDAGGFQIQPFHMALGLILLFFFGPFGALIALAICFFTQQRGGAPGQPRGAAPGGAGGGGGGANRQQPPPRAVFGGSGQRLGGN
ncbi:Protein CBG08424 [Caenorhabditis briggsae]|uniref:Protein CBG08424 n=1 Tax=Caenorhabditis briggsae TaxID=6238 RepID=A8X6I8_CAEBR|nr:Protein CBG08424 [Caenorhabditis briggsae]CAP28249.1 Protein CBG08424 [Caenorhabditis briggsae]